MIGTILGRKIEQSQRFTQGGKRIPVTKVLAGPCPVIQVKTGEKDKYWAIQLGFGEKKPKRVTKPILGHLRPTNLKIVPRFLREVKIEKPLSKDEEGKIKDLKVGKIINVGDVFTAGDKIAVTGISKGKGFAGVVKRWGFAGGPRTHGQSDRERAPGSIGSTTTPGRVYKGKKMAGRMGSRSVTIKNLEVVDIDKEKNLLTIKGLVPGPPNSLLIIRKI